MDGTTVLKHHIKHELCSTRPAYREGRDLKAVKVYSVAQESQYLLVQGVPAVGASAELIKLFALYGEILEYRILDQYPTDDNYTEVYWIKYKKIQSARFAKKKLDDYAFFGGALHICYAPEYESVQETKDKLRERRREVAVRLRKLKEASSSQSSLVSETATGDSSSILQTIATDTAPGSSQPGLDNTGHQHWSDSGHQHISSSGQRPGTDHHHHQHTKTQQDLQHETRMYNTPPPPPPPPPPFLPPPPLPQPHPPWGHTHHHPGYHPHPLYPSMHPEGRYGWGVPGLHPQPQGTPAGPPGHLTPGHHPVVTSHGHAGYSTGSDQQGALGGTNLRNWNNAMKQDLTEKLHGDKQSSVNKSHNNSLSRDGPTQPVVDRNLTSGDIVVKNFKPKNQTAPKFIPRQALQKIQKQSETKESSNADRDLLNEDLRRNACILGDVKGPAVKPGEERKAMEEEEKSVDNTVKQIRDKVKSFSTTLPLPIPKKKRKTESGS